MDISDITAILIAIMGAENTKNAAKIVEGYWELKSQDGFKFAESLAQTLFSPGIAEHVNELTICRSHFEATLTIGNQTKTYLSESGKDAFINPTTGNDMRPKMRRDATIPGNVLYEFAKALLED